MHQFFKKYKVPLIIVCIGILLRTIFFFGILRVSGVQGFYPSTNEDTREYLAIARNIAEHGVFSRSAVLPFEPETFRTPGYPAIIAGFLYAHAPITAFIIFQNLVFLACLIVSYYALASLYQKKNIAAVAIGVLALDPSIIYWNNQLTSETFFTVFLLASVLAFLFWLKKYQYKFLLTASLCLSFATLVRPISQFLVVFFCVFIVILCVKQKKWRTGALSFVLFILAFVLPLIPLIARNKIILRTTDLSTASEIAVGKYLSTYRDFTGNAPLFIKQDDPAYRYSAQRKLDIIAFFARNPSIFIRAHALGLLPFFFGDGFLTSFAALAPSLQAARVITDWPKNPHLFSFIFNHHGLEAVLFWSGKIVRVCLTLFALVGFVSWTRKNQNNRLHLVFFALLIYYFALLSGVGSYSRFRMPVDPYILIFVGLGVDFIQEKLRRASAPLSI